MAAVDAETLRAAEQAAAALPAEFPDRRVVFGFDGYVDRVREVVDDRIDRDTYERLESLADLNEQLDRSVAQESSLSFEWRQTGTRTGGHSAHLSRVFRGWGFDPVMIGHYGDPERAVFAEEFADCERHSLGEPGVTDAVEFDDGKLMLIESGGTMSLSWDTLESQVGREVLADRLDGAAVFGAGYWAETPNTPDVLEGLCDFWGDLADPPSTVILDPGDVRKLDLDRLAAGREAINTLADVAPVVVSANRAETRRLADAFGEASDDPLANARTAFDALEPTLFACHGLDRSIAVTDDGAASVAVPAVDDPALTTSAGDHFNAGLALAIHLGLSPAPALAVANAVAGTFVRSGDPPALSTVRNFLDDYETYF